MIWQVKLTALFQFLVSEGHPSMNLPMLVAARERKRFGVSVEEQQKWQQGTGQATREWRKRIEDHGVFTYMISMPPEVSGFSMFRDGVAAICVNDGQSTNGRKIFTMFHEYCHLLLRSAGVSDENSTNDVERYCNEFAASFLVPKDSLAQSVNGLTEVSDADVKRLAGRFRVSNSAMALRLEKTGFVARGSTPATRHLRGTRQRLRNQSRNLSRRRNQITLESDSSA